MTTHYARKNSFLKNNDLALCGKQGKFDAVSDNFKECDCRGCIAAMEAEEKHWHEVQTNKLIERAGA